MRKQPPQRGMGRLAAPAPQAACGRRRRAPPASRCRGRGRAACPGLAAASASAVSGPRPRRTMVKMRTAGAHCMGRWFSGITLRSQRRSRGFNSLPVHHNSHAWRGAAPLRACAPAQGKGYLYVPYLPPAMRKRAHCGARRRAGRPGGMRRSAAPARRTGGGYS